MTMIDMCFERTQFSVLILSGFFPDIAWNCNMTPVYIWSATAARSRWHQNKQSTDYAQAGCFNTNRFFTFCSAEVNSETRNKGGKSINMRTPY